MQFKLLNNLRGINNALTSQNTTQTNLNSRSIERAGLMAKGAATSMLAFGGAIALIGVGTTVLGVILLIAAILLYSLINVVRENNAR
ncbi:MAG: hypothetical protein EB153_09405 [Nitrosopumilaceae archaeon]|nr:hypothetical protein [Nitrosopumilaceae archaeon]